MPIEYEAGNVDLGCVGIIGLKELSGLELFVESCALVGGEGLWLFCNPFLGLSLLRGKCWMNSVLRSVRGCSRQPAGMAMVFSV